MPFDLHEFFDRNDVAQLEKEISMELEHLLCGDVEGRYTTCEVG